MARLLFLLLLLIQTPAWSQEFEKNLIFTTHDGLELSGNIWRAEVSDKTKVPGIIFINSWSLDEYEYTLIARKMAQQGYNVLSYSARGWGKSQGEVRVASPEDVKDVSSVIDWMIAHTNTDANRIALSGISYGAGISLLATASEPRIKAVAALSGWANLTESLMPGDVANELWARVLISIGRYTGDIPPELNEYIADLLEYKNIKPLKVWSQLRSASSSIEKTNENRPAILMINNWNDSLFNPLAVLDYFEKLGGPKRLVLREGIHGTGEAGGILGLTNASWDEVFAWFSEHLKSSYRRVRSSGALVKMQIRGTDEVDSYDRWPHPSLTSKEFALLSEDEEQTLIAGSDSAASTGIPLIGSFLDSHTPLDIGFWWFKSFSLHAFRFEGPVLKSVLKIRGNVNVKLRLSSQEKFQNIYVYLYEVSPFGYARLITHGPHRYKVGQAKFQMLDVRLFTTAYDLEAGSRLGLMIDTIDPTYADPESSGTTLIWRDSEKLKSILTLSVEN